MLTTLKMEAPPGTSLKSLVQGYLLTHQTQGSSFNMVKYYRGILGRFVWYADKAGWSDDTRVLNEWNIREFLGYVVTQPEKWIRHENGSESSSHKSSPRTVHHYFGALRAFFNWTVNEGYLKESTMLKIKIAKAKSKVIQPYSIEHLKKLLNVCDYDFSQGAKLLGSRNKAIILVFLDSGLRLSELSQINLNDIDTVKGWIKLTLPQKTKPFALRVSV